MLKELSCCWCVPGICRCKDSRLRLVPKKLRVLIEYHIYSELMVEGKEVERISYRPLAIDFYLFLLLMVGQSLQKTGALSMNFVTEVEMRK